MRLRATADFQAHSVGRWSVCYRSLARTDVGVHHCALPWGSPHVAASAVASSTALQAAPLLADTAWRT